MPAGAARRSVRGWLHVTRRQLFRVLGQVSSGETPECGVLCTTTLTYPAMTDAGRDTAALADVLRKRAPLLEALADGPLTQRDVRDELGVSRSTVYSALRELESAGLVVGRPEGYALTGLGRLAWRRRDCYLARLDRLTVADRLLASVPSD